MVDSEGKTGVICKEGKVGEKGIKSTTCRKRHEGISSDKLSIFVQKVRRIKVVVDVLYGPGSAGRAFPALSSRGLQPAGIKGECVRVCVSRPRLKH